MKNSKKFYFSASSSNPKKKPIPKELNGNTTMKSRVGSIPTIKPVYLFLCSSTDWILTTVHVEKWNIFTNTCQNKSVYDGIRGECIFSANKEQSGKSVRCKTFYVAKAFSRTWRAPKTRFFGTINFTPNLFYRLQTKHAGVPKIAWTVAAFNI